MAEVELIGVPFDGYGRTGNQARRGEVLREAGLVAAFDGHVVVAVDEMTCRRRSLGAVPPRA